MTSEYHHTSITVNIAWWFV